MFINHEDVLYILTVNPTEYIEGVKNLIGKMIIFRETLEVNLFILSHRLNFIKIEKLSIISIDTIENLDEMETINIEGPSPIVYVRIGINKYLEFLNTSNTKFLEYNKDVLYILRCGDYSDLKEIYTKIEQHNVNLCRGGSQKAHIISPLDYRLSSYLMALSNFNYKKLSYLNSFNDLSKDRYLPSFRYTLKKN